MQGWGGRLGASGLRAALKYLESKRHGGEMLRPCQHKSRHGSRWDVPGSSRGGGGSAGASCAAPPACLCPAGAHLASARQPWHRGELSIRF